MEKWNEVKLVPEFSEQGVDCYRLAGGDYENEYYVVSEAETRKSSGRATSPSAAS